MPALIRKSRALGNRAARSAQKARACARILALLQAGPMTSVAVSDALKMNHSTGGTYLRHMRDKLRVVHVITDRSQARARMWAAGPPRDWIEEEETYVRFDARRSTVPARQIGMTRDPLIAALYGPAQNPQ